MFQRYFQVCFLCVCVYILFILCDIFKMKSSTMRRYLDLEKQFVALAAPMCFVVVVQLGLAMVTVMFAGMIDEDTLAGVGLANTVYNVFQFSLMYGYSSVIDTYGPQVFGSLKERNHLGTVLIKVLLQGFVVWLISLGPYLNLVYFLRFMAPATQEFEVVIVRAVMYFRITCGLGLLDFIYDALGKYLSIQGMQKSIYCLSTVTLGFHIIYNYILIVELGLGVVGLGLACIATRLTGLAFAGVYLLYKRSTLAWAGFTPQVWQNWSEMVKLGLSGSMNIFAEMGVYEVATFLTQYIGQTALNTTLIFFQYCCITWAFGMGIAYSTSVLLGKALAQHDKEGSIMIMKLAVTNAFLLGLTISFLEYGLRFELPKLFSEDEAVRAMTASITWIVALNVTIENVQTCLSRGILVGFGKQRFIAVVLVILAYGVNTPLTFVSVFVAKLGPEGIWLNLLAFCLMSGCINGVKLLFFVDLDRELENVKERVDLTTTSISGEEAINSDKLSIEGSYGAICENGDKRNIPCATSQAYKKGLLFLLAGVWSCSLLGISLLKG